MGYRPAMTENSFSCDQQRQGFDLIRLSRSKQAADICPNTIRAYAREGLSLYRSGRAVFFSLRELEFFIRTRSDPRSRGKQVSKSPGASCAADQEDGSC
jgi:hypothetical protein